MKVCAHRPNGLGARNEDGLMVCSRCGRSYDDERVTDPPPVINLTPDLRPVGVTLPCPSFIEGPFIGSDATYMRCGGLLGHDGEHYARMTWTEPDNGRCTPEETQ